jgi:hypothetical protein
MEFKRSAGGNPNRLRSTSGHGDFANEEVRHTDVTVIRATRCVGSGGEKHGNRRTVHLAAPETNFCENALDL